MTRSKIVLVERPGIPVVAPGTLIIFADNNELYMKDDAQVVTQITGNAIITAGTITTDTLTADSITSGTAQFGNVASGDYSEFEADGTLQALGNATCWRDELQSLTGARLQSPASDVVENIPEATITFETGARYATDYVTTNHQLNHDWSLGTLIYPHLHWWQVSANVPNWLIGYRWQKGGDAKTTSWMLAKYSGSSFTYTSGTLNQITEFGTITPPVGYGQVSDIIQFRLYRDVTNVSTLFAGADPEGSDVEAVNFDCHMIVDTLGSRQEYVK